MLIYSKGRTQYIYKDCIQIEIPRVATLTHFKNGDYKLSNQEMVYFWHQEEKTLDKYSITI